MVRAIGLLVVALFVWAESVQEKVIGLIGEEKFIKNQAILHSVFLDESRYEKSDGLVDVVKIAKILKRLGFIQEKFAAPRLQRIEFFSYNNPRLVYKIVFDLLKSALFGYRIVSIKQDSDGVVIVVNYTSNLLADPVKIGKFLGKNGIKIIDISHTNNRWVYTLDASEALLDCDTIQDKKVYKSLRAPLWIKLINKTKVIVQARLSHHWYPALYLYDDRLKPLRSVVYTTKVDRVELSLPSGLYYIKIADRFTIKNIKHGIVVVAK